MDRSLKRLHIWKAIELCLIPPSSPAVVPKAGKQKKDPDGPFSATDFFEVRTLDPELVKMCDVAGSALAR
jgi:hypothetical protein